jgi:hypothetical protein
LDTGIGNLVPLSSSPSPVPADITSTLASESGGGSRAIVVPEVTVVPVEPRLELVVAGMIVVIVDEVVVIVIACSVSGVVAMVVGTGSTVCI